MNQFDNEVSSTLKEIAERVETPPYLKDRIDKELCGAAQNIGRKLPLFSAVVPRSTAYRCNPHMR